ncbi:hypothetical protein BX659_105152 [Orenia metallireducens]|uniref:hypothetical protein n=1 Tax=Orenia metallireducens TaxID=1413210 RepID=UPI000D051B85|nr:hypothetical protein [Orenia metallireducens]PRX31821.1 hypothetical protein BX659_105152 [Orenia metallireducens]
MEISLIQSILAIFPEFLLIGYVGLGLLSIKIRLNKYLKIAGSCTIFLIIIRNIFNLYGMHVILGVLFLAVLFKVIVKLDWHIAIISSLLGYIVLFLGEVAITPHNP